MLTFIRMEFLKIKRSKLFYISLLSGIALPIFMFISAFYIHVLDSNRVLLFSSYLTNLNMYMNAVLAVFIFCIIVSYLFGREYAEHTLKSILTRPVSRKKYLCGKFLMFLIWILILATVSFITCCICSILGGVQGISLSIAVEYYLRMLLGGFLLFLPMSPFVFIGMIMKNIIPGIICGVVAFMINMIAYQRPYAPYCPWISPFIISSGEIYNYSTGLITPILILIIVFSIGTILSWLYLAKSDVPL